MASDVRLLRPEVLLRTWRYLTPDRSQSEPLGPPHWSSAEYAYGFTQGERYRLHFFEQPHLSGDYIVANPISIGLEPRTTDEGTVVDIPTATVYMASLELWPLMEQKP